MAGATDYVDGTYLEQNPGWHVTDSPWKAEQILKALRRNKIFPATVLDVGCGAGEILWLLQQSLGADCELWGTDVSPQAIELTRQRANGKLHFAPWYTSPWVGKFYDLVLVIDVLAHVEDYRGFLREVKKWGGYKLLHIPMDISVQHILRPKAMAERRKGHPHLHYFTKSTAMFALNDLGFEIVDWSYTPRAVDIPDHLRGRILRQPRKLLFRADPDLAATLLGGFSLMVLAK
jgi:SAM-dependent methyltransferase